MTNPPIDPIREELVTSLISYIGPKPNVLDVNDVEQTRRIEVSQPVLTDAEMRKLLSISDYTSGKVRSKVIDITYPAAWGSAGVEACLAGLCAQAVDAIKLGHTILILSDEAVSKDRVAIPALLATSALHQHLIAEGLRTTTGLVVSSGSATETHDFALLMSYGAEAVHPYMALMTLKDLAPKAGLSPDEAVAHYVKAVGKGLTKVMAKMGISTLMSYRGARIFEAIGLQSAFVERYFTGTPSQIDGIGLFEVMQEAINLHKAAYGIGAAPGRDLPTGGEYAWRADGEEHMWTPEAIVKLQKASREKNWNSYREYADIINDQSRRQMTLRDLLRFRTEGCTPVPLDEVEPAKDIVRRFATGAMSLGSISAEAHATLAVAMNRIGAKSTSGEGGEDPRRYEAEMMTGLSPVKAGQTLADVLGSDRIVADVKLEAGDSLRSKVKQVASARFGVTAQYLASADQIQIKMAQGAKPGEGGQLPGHKVTEYIAELRYSVPGVGLISPPPHHDIYSIEDLAQLIHDLKTANSAADVSVKLVSETGVGTVAAGVAKAKADHIVISGHGRKPALVGEARGQRLGARSLRSSADARRQRPAQPRCDPGRRPDQDGARRRHRRHARRGRIRLCDSAARRRRLHDDAPVPPQHMSRRHRHAGSGTQEALPRQARRRHQLLLLRGRRGPSHHGRTRHPPLRGPDRQVGPARAARRHRQLEGEGRGSLPHPSPSERRALRHPPHARSGPSA